MGMFDWVKYEMDCPRCGTPLHDFQSKDADCCLEELSPGKVKNFYTDCCKCRMWVNFETVVQSYTVVPSWEENQPDFRDRKAYDAMITANIQKHMTPEEIDADNAQRAEQKRKFEEAVAKEEDDDA